MRKDVKDSVYEKMLQHGSEFGLINLTYPSFRRVTSYATTLTASDIVIAVNAQLEVPREGEGADMELGKVLTPLNEFRDKMVFIRGLYNAEALKGNIHSSQTGNLLSGAPLAPGGRIQSGTSVDQLVARHIGHRTKPYPVM